MQEDVKPGQVLDYYLQVGHGLVNGKKLNTSYAIVQLLDYSQVPVRYDASDYVYYGFIDVNESSSVHLSLKAPDTDRAPQAGSPAGDRPLRRQRDRTGRYEH